MCIVAASVTDSSTTGITSVTYVCASTRSATLPELTTSAATSAMMTASTTTATTTTTLRTVQRRPDEIDPRRQPAVIAEKLTRVPAGTLEPHQGGRSRPPWGQDRPCDRAVYSPAAPLATLTSLLVERQLTVGRMASNSTRSLCSLAVSMSTAIVASSRKCGLSPNAGSWVATAW